MPTIWKAEDIYNCKSHSSMNYSPVKNEMLYVLNAMNRDENRYVCSIVKHDLEIGTEDVTVKGDFINKSPKYLPDGEGFLFLSDRDGVMEVYKYDFSTKEVERLTFSGKGVFQFTISPKGDEFYFVTHVKKGLSKFAEGENTVEKDEVTVIEELGYFANGKGIIDKNFVESVCSQKFGEKEAKVLCRCSLGYGMKNIFDVSPCGNYLAVCNVLVDDDPYHFDTGVFLYDLNSKKSECLNTWRKGVLAEPKFSPNGKYIALIGNDKDYHTSHQTKVCLYDIEKKVLKNLMEDVDVQVSDFAVTDFKSNNINSMVQWSSDSSLIYFQVTVDGRVALYSVDLNGKCDAVVDDLQHITEFAKHPRENSIIIAVSSPLVMSKLVYCNLDTGEKAGVKFFELGKDMAKYRQIEYKASDGGKIPGFLVTPKEFEKDKKYPVIVNIHGGPYAMHCATFHHEVQLMCANGYAVLLPNPRGSFGYGQEHLDKVVGKYAEGDYTDIMEFVDGALKEFNFLDENRMFVAGGSYGGFMTNWIIANTDKFKAAVTQRSISNFVSEWGTSDIGYYFYKTEMDADILDFEKLWKHSPMSKVKNVKTPTLIIHAEEDYRCPMGQAEEWFSALKYLGVEVRFVRFPNSNHELSRSGVPSLRVRRLKEMMDWFNKYNVLQEVLKCC